MKYLLKTALLLLSFTFISTHHLCAQAPSVIWQKTYGGVGDDNAQAFTYTLDGGYIMALESDSNSGDVTGIHGRFSYDYWIVKVNSTGGIEWSKSLGSSGADEPYAIVQTTDGGYAIAGYTTLADGDVTSTHSPNTGDYWLVKLNSSGTLQWQHTYGGTGDDRAYSMVQTSDGGFAMMGWSTSTDGDISQHLGGNDYWVVKVNSVGQLQWERSLGGSGDDYGSTIAQTADGGYIVGGESYSMDGNITDHISGADGWLVKLSSTGSIRWSKSLGSIGGDYVSSVITTRDGGYAITGTSDGLTGNHRYEDIWTAKLDSTGTELWEKSLGGTGQDFGKAIAQTADGGYIVAGQSKSDDGDVTAPLGGGDAWVIKLSSNGGIQWDKSLGGTNGDLSAGVIQRPDGKYTILCSTMSNDGDVTGAHGAYDGWLVTLGNVTAGIPDIETDAVKLYPNPATDIITLHISENLIGSAYTITDLTGNILQSEKATSSDTAIPLGRLSAGMYTVHIGGKTYKIVKR